MARVLGPRGPGVPRLARRAARGHLPHGSEHLPPDVGFRRRRGPGGPRRVQGRRRGIRRRAHASVQGGVLLLAGGATRVGMFPVITGATGAERIYDGYPDVALEMIEHRTFDGRIQLVEYKPRVLEHPPLGAPA